MSEFESRTTTDKTFYLYDPDTDIITPYKPDYSVDIPFTVTRTVVREARKGHGPKQDKELGVIVPLIRQPPNQSDWVQLATIAQKYPRINIIAVVSPTQDQRGIGDFGGPIEDYANAIRFLQHSGVIVVGYLDTAEVSKSLDDAKREIDRWSEWYPDINGLFFDNASISLGAVQYYRLLDEYCKKEKSFQFTIADMASSIEEGVAVMDTEGFLRNTEIDIFVIYEKEGYPAELWYQSIKKEWMTRYDRSRFAFISYAVNENTLDCRNFIEKVVGIERLAGYLYIHSSYSEIDKRGLREWTNISPLLEVTLNELDRLAQGENIPSFRGVVPDSVRPITDEEIQQVEAAAKSKVVSVGGGTEEELKPESTVVSQEQDHPEAVPRDEINTDKFGIRKIYQSAEGPISKEWSLFMDNPRADQTIAESLPERMEKDVDGSWMFPRDFDIRLEAWSPPQNKYRDVEMTGYFKIQQLPQKRGQDVVIEQHARGGKHNDKENPCEASGYKARLLKDGTVDAVKQIMYGVQTGSRAVTQATNNALEKRWMGMKTMIYNYTDVNSRTGADQHFVNMEVWIDDNVTDQDGNLVIKNDWKPIMKMSDQGGWFVQQQQEVKKTKKKGRKGKKKEEEEQELRFINCRSLNANNAELEDERKRNFRQLDEIITEPGGNPEKNCVAWRWNGAIINFKFLSVREINVRSLD